MATHAIFAIASDSDAEGGVFDPRERQQDSVLTITQFCAENFPPNALTTKTAKEFTIFEYTKSTNVVG